MFNLQMYIQPIRTKTCRPVACVICLVEPCILCLDKDDMSKIVKQIIVLEDLRLVTEPCKAFYFPNKAAFFLPTGNGFDLMDSRSVRVIQHVFVLFVNASSTDIGIEPCEFVSKFGGGSRILADLLMSVT